ncbi:hypothetical protein QVD17_41198 [Tagetes erecta]|uniref:Uncharacterized protein n=1 Tax=Tagetes erecta TaxID=13708 RepID=A0AAD8JWP7_TARER|nr:hypothetical protein QVD17_41198 [Tagetes erecta]
MVRRAGMLQMVSEPVVGRCASEDAGPPRGVDWSGPGFDRVEVEPVPTVPVMFRVQFQFLGGTGTHVYPTVQAPHHTNNKISIVSSVLVSAIEQSLHNCRRPPSSIVVSFSALIILKNGSQLQCV